MRHKLGFALACVVVGIVIGRVADPLAWLAPLARAQEATPPSEDAPARETGTVPADQPRYLEAMRTELERMSIEGARCERTDPQRAHCQFTHRGAQTHRDFTVHLAYSDYTDTVYFYVDGYLTAASDAPTTDRLMRRLMELNWTMLVGKFEWDPTDGEVRLALVLNTDSNFDRRAFRSSVRAIAELADRYHTELSRIQTPTP